MISSLLPWVVGAVVVAGAAWGLWLAFGRREAEEPNPYPRGLEAWLAGDFERAESFLRQAVRQAPDSVEPFLHLGDLLRLRGDAERAAVLHRGMTVRPDLPRSRRVDVGLALAEDLLALQRWQDAAATLETVASEAAGRARYWWARFRQYHGQEDHPEAARSLKRSLKRVPERDRPELEAAYIAYQLDRSLGHALDGDESGMTPRLKDVQGYPAAKTRSALVRALAAAVQGDAAQALALGAERLLDSPRELAVLMPYLQRVLLESGQYARTIPLLENACRAVNAPPSLVIDLALLYEKLGRRTETLRLIESRSTDSDLTPDLAAPLLKLLFAEAGESDARRVWKQLGTPHRHTRYICDSCQQESDRMRWFCPECGAFDSYVARLAAEGEDL